MKLILFLFLAASWLFAADSTMVDFTCATVTGATVDSPAVGQTTLTCAAPHTYAGNASAFLSIPTAPVNGDTFTIAGPSGTQTYTLVTTVNNSVANQIQIPTAAESGGLAANIRFVAAYRITAAINGTAQAFECQSASPSAATCPMTQMAGVYYSTSTVANPDVRAGVEYNGKIWIQAITPGVGGQSILLSHTGTNLTFLALDAVHVITNLKIQWFVFLSGATGTWTGINRPYANVVNWPATYVSPTEFSVYYNSHTSGSFSGQTLGVWRANAQNFRFMYGDTDQNWATTTTQQEGQLSITIPGCLPASNDFDCAAGFGRPDNQKGYADTGQITSFVVSGGVATVTWASAWVQHVATDTMAVNAPVWFRGYQKYFNAAPVTAVASDGSGHYQITASNHGCLSTDLAAVNSTGTTADGEAQALTVVDANNIILSASTYAAGWVSGGTLTCNPNGFSSQAEAGYMSRSSPGSGCSTATRNCPSPYPLRIWRVQTYNSSTNTATIDTTLRDGSYAGTCASPASACPIGVAYPYLAITPRAYAYPYISSRNLGGNSSFGPVDLQWWNTKNGTYDPQSNRIRVSLTWGRDGAGVYGSYGTQLGTYLVTQNADAIGGAIHYYNDTWENWYQGAHMLWEFNNVPSHVVGQSSASGFPESPSGLPGQNQSPAFSGGAPRTLMMANGLFYIDLHMSSVGTTDGLEASGQTVLFQSVINSTELNAPEEYVNNKVTQWSDHRYISGTLQNDAGYEQTWTSPSFDASPWGNTTFQLHWSTTGSMRANGWSTGTDGTSAIRVADQYGDGNLWQSPTMAEAPSMWIAVRPVAGTRAASVAGQPIWLITRSSLNMQVGDHITTTGNGGNRDVTNQAITGVNPWQIWWRFTPSTGGAWTVPYTLNSIVASSGTCTVSLTVPHNLVPGWMVEVNGSTNATLGQAPGDISGSAKLFIVSNVVDANTFQFPCAGVADGTYNTDYSVYHLNVQAYPGIQLAGTATGTWTGAGTIVSTEENKNFTETLYQPPATGSGTLFATPTPLTFACVVGTNPPSQSLTIDASGVTLDNWSATKTQSWLGLTPTSGIATGATTVSVTCPGTAGSYSDTITVASTTAGINNSPITVAVNLTVTQVLVTTTTLAGGVWTVPYSQTLAATGGTAPYTWVISAGGLPAGLTLSTAGVISGTPIIPVGFASTFSVVATDALGNASPPAPLSITVPSPGANSIFGGFGVRGR
jgi:hypothetical protein